jgi:hypothetical protein
MSELYSLDIASIMSLTLLSNNVTQYGASPGQSSEHAPFDSRYALMWKESVNALPKLVGFLRISDFLPQEKLTG